MVLTGADTPSTPSRRRRVPLSPAGHSPIRAVRHTPVDRVRFSDAIVSNVSGRLFASDENHGPPTTSNDITRAIPKVTNYTPDAPFVKRKRISKPHTILPSTVPSEQVPTLRTTPMTPTRPHLTRDTNVINVVNTPSSEYTDFSSLHASTTTPACVTPTAPSPQPRPSTFSDQTLSLERKLNLILQYFQQLDLPFHDFMYEVFRTPTSSEKESWGVTDRMCFRKRASVISRFLRGQASHTPAQVLDLWIRHPYGRAHKDSEDMFSFASSRRYLDIGPIRPALSSFAVQVIENELVKQARNAVKPDAGLHLHIPTVKNPTKRNVSTVDWRSLGLQTYQKISGIHQAKQPLLWGLLTAVASPDGYQTQDKHRDRRPIEAVISTVISKLTFSRSPYARLGPVLDGLFNIASNVSFDKFRYVSHVGNTPSYQTVLRILYGLSQQAADQTIEVCRDLGRWFWIVIDNVQNYIRRRSLRLGRDNFMNIGMAGTVWVAPTSAADPSVFDYDEKQKLRAQCQRDEITTAQLLNFIDREHERRVFALQWLWVLGNYVPCLEHLKSHANHMLRTQARLQKVPEGPTQAFPLPTTSGSETQLPEFLDSVLDFLKSAGQSSDRYHKRMLPIGGDGLTFELLHRLQQQRQFHSSPFHSLRILNPMLQWWHCFWTNDSRIVDRHLVSYASKDPSTLGHSASKIGRKIPVNQGKYDYHQTTDLLYLVTDMRILDCWRLRLLKIAEASNINTASHQDVFDIIRALQEASKLPTQAQFEQYAYELHDMYTTDRAVCLAARGMESPLIPRGTKWTSSQPSDNRNVFSTPSQTPSASRSKILDALDSAGAFTGDLVLARSKDLMRESIRSREVVWSAAEGDVGRVWAQMKFMMFSFAGSSHKKYAQYLLETVIDLQLESSPQLREALLSSAVANLSGLPGSYKPTDLLQEYFQRILEAIVQHKGAEFGERFIRQGIARNLAHFQRLKEEVLGGVGLDRHSRRRSKPSIDAEMRILLKEYRETRLHVFCEGRTFGESEAIETQFAIGLRNLESGLLQKWTTRMMLMRDRLSSGSSNDTPDLMDSVRQGSNASAEDGDPDLEDSLFVPTSPADYPLYAHNVVDGQIATSVLDPEADAQDVIAMLEALDGGSQVSEPNDEDSSNITNASPVPVDDGFMTDEDDCWEQDAI